MIFDNKSSVLAFSQHEECNFGNKAVNDSGDLLFSTRRPQGFMTGIKGKKIFMTVDEIDEAKELATSPYVNLSMTNLRQ